MKIGIGQDSHPFELTNAKPLILGGIKFEGNGCKGNSDGDVIIHSLCNALGSALGKGSLATYSDPMCKEKGIKDSTEYLKVPVGWLMESGYEIENVSVAIEAKYPKIEPRRQEMQERLAQLLGISPVQVGITATTGEGLTAFGRGEGVQVFSVVLLKEQKEN